MKKNSLIYSTICLLAFLFILMGAGQAFSAQENTRTIAILPFKINAPEKLTHIQKGIGHMLYSRLSWKDKVIVVPPQIIAKQLSRIEDTKAGQGINEIIRVTQSDFILAGAITRLGGSFSIDVQVYDIKNKRYMAFFEQSRKSGDLIRKTNHIAAVINKKVLGRSTSAWEKMEKKNQFDAQEQIRKNPEYLMKIPGWQDTEKSPGWKIWKYFF